MSQAAHRLPPPSVSGGPHPTCCSREPRGGCRGGSGGGAADGGGRRPLAATPPSSWMPASEPSPPPAAAPRTKLDGNGVVGRAACREGRISRRALVGRPLPPSDSQAATVHTRLGAGAAAISGPVRQWRMGQMTGSIMLWAELCPLPQENHTLTP